VLIGCKCRQPYFFYKLNEDEFALEVHLLVTKDTLYEVCLAVAPQHVLPDALIRLLPDLLRLDCTE
jgi:hypothetical protein